MERRRGGKRGMDRCMWLALFFTVIAGLSSGWAGRKDLVASVRQAIADGWQMRIRNGEAAGSVLPFNTEREGYGTKKKNEYSFFFFAEFKGISGK